MDININASGLTKYELCLQNLNALVNELYCRAANKGFHDNDNEPGRVGEYVSNLHGEVSELWEAYRKGKLNEQCDKPVSLTCAEEELADIFIRCCDTAASLKVDLERAVKVKMQYNLTREHMHGKKC
jgi:NTP pyrophosphatase (non-canonical NTP hydrolase)